jgi:hypothetical protein
MAISWRAENPWGFYISNAQRRKQTSQKRLHPRDDAWTRLGVGLAARKRQPAAFPALGGAGGSAC